MSTTITPCQCGSGLPIDDDGMCICCWFREATSRATMTVEAPYPHHAINTAWKAQDRFYGHGDGAVTYAEVIRQEGNQAPDPPEPCPICGGSGWVESDDASWFVTECDCTVQVVS